MNETEIEYGSCQRCESPLEHGDLRCAICGQSTPDDFSAEAAHTHITILRCKGCGAALRYDPKHQAPSCSFCGDTIEPETIEDPMEQTEAYLPFTVTADQARETLRTWLGSQGWFRPSDLSRSAQLTQLKPLWWVAWVFDAHALISWTSDSNANNRRSAWAPHSGQDVVDFDDIVVSASRGLSQSEVQAIAPGMNLSTAKLEPSGAQDDATIEQFDVQRSLARQYVTGSIQSLAAQHCTTHFVPGTRFRNTRVSVVLRRLVTRRLSFPAYVLVYRYKQQLYRVVICGQDRRLVTGKSPISKAKVFFLILVLVVFALIMLAILAGQG